VKKDFQTKFHESYEIIPESGCWIWTKGSMTSGYGSLRVGDKSAYAHRVSWEVHHGPIPAGMHVLHRCDVRSCVSPHHLFLGTNQDNIADSVSKGRRKGITRRRPSGLKYNWTKKPGPKAKVAA
jgi:hypothetical protein